MRTHTASQAVIDALDKPKSATVNPPSLSLTHLFRARSRAETKHKTATIIVESKSKYFVDECTACRAISYHQRHSQTIRCPYLRRALSLISRWLCFLNTQRQCKKKTDNNNTMVVHRRVGRSRDIFSRSLRLASRPDIIDTVGSDEAIA